MTHTERNELADALRQASYANLPGLAVDTINYHGEGSVGTVTTHMLEQAVEQIRTAAYVEARAWGYDHDASVKKCNKRAAKVRKAIGFTYPTDDVRF